jgi:hypothetical protein
MAGPIGIVVACDPQELQPLCKLGNLIDIDGRQSRLGLTIMQTVAK